MASYSPKRLFFGDEGEERYHDYVGSQTSMDRPARPENVKSTSFELASTSNTPRSSGPCPPLYDKKAGPLTKQEMEKSRQFGGDDYIIIASKFRKTNDEVRREKEAIIREFEVMAKEWQKELWMEPIVFANTDLAIALVGNHGCRLGFSDGSAYLDIPAEALQDYQIIYMYKLPEHTDVTGPADQKKIYSYSGLITCGPEGTTFDKDVTLNFEHCAAPDDNQSSTRLAVFGRANETTPWVKEEHSSFGVKGNRVEHRFEHFSQRCYGLNETDVVNAPRLRMCLMLAVSRVRRHYVEAVLMRDEISLINSFSARVFIIMTCKNARFSQVFRDFCKF